MRSISRDDQSQMVLLWGAELTTIYYIDRVRISLNDTLSNRPIVLHEFGHAMGLGHRSSSDEEDTLKT